MGVMLNHYIKVFIILFLLCLWEQGLTWQLLKQITNLFSQMSVQLYSLLGQTEGERKTFSEISPKSNLVVMRDEKSLSFCEIQNNPTPPPLCFLLDPLTNNTAGHEIL